jgi:hypothetical protein
MGDGVTMKQTIGTKRRRATWFIAGFWLIWYAGTVVEAGSLYLYTDAQGQAVLTDNVQQVPVEFRGRLRAVTSGEAPATGVMTSASELAPSGPLSTSSALEGILYAVAQKVHPIKGFTAHQTAVLLMMGACWIGLLGLLFLSANPALRILAKCSLVLVSLAAFYQLTIGDVSRAGTVTGSAPETSAQSMDTIMGHMKTKTEQSYRLQNERNTGQLEQAEPLTP